MMEQMGCPFPLLRIDPDNRSRVGRIPIPSVYRPNKLSPPREVRLSVVMPIHFSIFTSRSSNQQIPFPAIWR